ncbi:MAG TPA: hypothetical protein VN794_12285, partial [Methylomirabilota bacterium]|nr:hypothetical protein [Methylomirabilota bacterium]
QISPGSTSPGRLTVTGACVFASSGTLSVFLGGTNAGVTHDQLQCGAAVNLGSAHLVISRDPNFLPAIGSSFTILSKTGAGAVTGTFAGLPQGASTNVGGIFFQVSYAGGDGNDVTLTVTNRDFQVWDGGGANNLWTTAANWEGDHAPAVSNHLAFPRGAPDAVTTNDFPIDTVFNSLRFTGSAATNNYPLLRGNSIKLLSGIVATNLGSQGVVAIELPLKLAASQTFSNASANTAIELRSDLAVAPFALTVRGAGIFRATGSILGANNTNLVLVNGGHLIVNGTVTGPLSVTGGGDLAGTGTMDGLGLTNSSLSPGDGGPGVLKVRGGLSLNSGSTLNLELNDSGAGTGYDQLVVSNGNANISLATLNLVVRSNLTSTIGDQFTLANLTNPTNTVTGSFAGLSNGTVFTNNARVFRISYSGGDGNDVVLALVDVVATSATRQWAGGDPVTNLWSARSNWFPTVAPVPGDNLAFATPNSRLTNFNDFPADTSFGSIFFAVPFSRVVNYSLAGNPIRLSGGVGLGPAAPSSLDMQGLVLISNRITLNRSQIFTNALDARLRFAGNILLGTNTLFANVRGNTDIFLDGSLQGPGRLELDGPGRVNLNASNALTGEMFVSNGVLIATHPQALGSSQAGPVRVGAAGSLRFLASNTVFSGSSIQLTGRLEVVLSTNSILAAPLTVAGTNAVVALNQAVGSTFTLQASVTNQGQLTLGDPAFSGGGTLRLAPSGSIEGNGVLRMRGPFDANGTIHNTVQIESAFSGAGQVDTLICSNLLASVVPGSLTDPALAFSPLRVGQLRLGAGVVDRLTMNLFPNRPGGGPTNQSIITSGAPVLGGARLRVNALTNLSPGQKFMLLRNDSAAPVTNTFSGLPEGAFLAATNGNL